MTSSGKRLLGLLALLCLTFFFARQAHAKKCTRVLPEAVFRFFGDADASKVDCEDYVFRLVDLNKDDVEEIIVYKKQFSCTPRGTCDHEIFRKLGDDFKNVGTLPGRFEIKKSKTDGFADIVVWTANKRRVFYKWNGREYKPTTFGKERKKGDQSPKDDPFSSLP